MACAAIAAVCALQDKVYRDLADDLRRAGYDPSAVGPQREFNVGKQTLNGGKLTGPRVRLSAGPHQFRDAIALLPRRIRVAHAGSRGSRRDHHERPRLLHLREGVCGRLNRLPEGNRIGDEPNGIHR